MTKPIAIRKEREEKNISPPPPFSCGFRDSCASHLIGQSASHCLSFYTQGKFPFFALPLQQLNFWAVKVWGKIKARLAQADFLHLIGWATRLCELCRTFALFVPGSLVQRADSSVSQRQNPDGGQGGLGQTHAHPQGTLLAQRFRQLLLRGGELARKLQVSVHGGLVLVVKTRLNSKHPRKKRMPRMRGRLHFHQSNCATAARAAGPGL